jgi:hypothetical protein
MIVSQETHTLNPEIIPEIAAMAIRSTAYLYLARQQEICPTRRYEPSCRLLHCHAMNTHGAFIHNGEFLIRWNSDI